MCKWWAFATTVVGAATIVATTAVSAAQPPLPSELRERGELVVGTYCDYAPFGSVGPDGKPRGIDVDIAHTLAEYAFGDRDAITLKCTKSADRIPNLQTGKIDFAVAVLGITPTRAEVIDFTKPYFASTTVFMSRKGNSFDSFEDLQGETLLLSSGTPWITWLQKCEPDIDLKQFSSKTSAVAALQSGRGIAFLNDSTMLYPLAAKNDAFMITGPDVREQGYAWGFGVRKDDEDMLTWLNAQIDRMQKEDVFWEIVQKWQEDPEILERSKQVIRRPGKTPDYSSYQASTTRNPECPE